MKPTFSLVLFSIVAFAFGGMLAFSEYAFACRMVILVCVVVIIAVKLSNGHLERILFGKLNFGLIRNIDTPVFLASAYHYNSWVYCARFLWLWVEIHCDLE